MEMGNLENGADAFMFSVRESKWYVRIPLSHNSDMHFGASLPNDVCWEKDVNDVSALIRIENAIKLHVDELQN